MDKVKVKLTIAYNGANYPTRLASFFAWDPSLSNGLQMLGSNASNTFSYVGNNVNTTSS